MEIGQVWTDGKTTREIIAKLPAFEKAEAVVRYREDGRQEVASERVMQKWMKKARLVK